MPESPAKIKEYIDNLFVEINSGVNRIVRSHCSDKDVQDNLKNYLHPKISSAMQSCSTELFNILSKQTLSEEIFKSTENANKFYDLGLKELINNAWHPIIDELNVNFKAPSQSGKAVLVGGASGGCNAEGSVFAHIRRVITYLINLVRNLVLGDSSITHKNHQQKRLKRAIDELLNSLKQELLAWVDNSVSLYKSEVKKLKESL